MKSKAKFVLSKKIVSSQYAKMAELADQVSYSVKTNKEVARILNSNTNCLFSIHSANNAELMEDKSRVLFFLQGTSKEELEELTKLGISKFVVDNLADLEAVKEFLTAYTDKITLLLRMRLKEHTVHTGKHFVFGLYSDDINRLIPELRNNSKIEKLGLHFHRKTQNISEWSIKDEFKECISVLDMLDIVNIGGGIPSKYKNFREEVLQNIFKKITEMKDFLNQHNIKMIIEPGRYIAAPSIKLVTNILSVYNNTIVVDASVFNAAMDTFVAHLRLLVENELDKGPVYTIKGCTPDSLDIFRYQVHLYNPKVGDQIVFLNAGAYNFHTNFCGLEQLPTEVVE